MYGKKKNFQARAIAKAKDAQLIITTEHYRNGMKEMFRVWKIFDVKNNSFMKHFMYRIKMELQNV